MPIGFWLFSLHTNSLICEIQLLTNGLRENINSSANCYKKVLQSSKRDPFSLYGFSCCSSDETHILSLAEWSILGSLSQLPTDHSFQKADKVRDGENC